MDSQQVFLVPQVPPLPTNNSSPIHHQPQKCTTQMVQQRQLHHMQPQCNICGTTQKLLRCAKCKTIYYCSTDHQHKDWQTHKQECRQMANKRQNNNRLTQLTNGCGAININSQSICNTSSSTSSTIPSNNWSSSIAQQQQPAQQQPLQNSNSHNVEGSFIISSSHEKPILIGKEAEAVTQISKRSNFDANSTTTDQMHIMAQNDTLDLYDMIESSQEFMDNPYYYQTTQVPDELESRLQQESNATSSTYEDSSTRQPVQQQHGNELVSTDPGLSIPSEANSSSHQEQQHNFIQQQTLDYVQQQQPVLQYPIPQLSNHLINQHEKSSSYQIGTPVFDESIFENANEQRYEELCRNIIRDMNQYGLSVVDDFLGRDNGLQILNEVHRMYSAGVFKDGQLVNNMKSEQDLRTIRGDKITWVKGVEPGCSNVGYLINQIDAVICRANSMLNNGKLGDYVIKERTKAMVACYPGSGSHYVMHVDNPNKDGRVITAIYYLNLNWDSRDSGGVLRIFPEQTKCVADIEPKFDRLIFFWSDKRNPHEVQPAHRTRYAITVWYFDANEREQALNRCKKTQNENELKHKNKSLSRTTKTTTTNPLTNSNITDNTATTDTTIPSSNSSSSSASSASSASSLTSFVATTETSSPLNDSSDLSTVNLMPTAATNAPRPIQVVRPNIYK